MIPNIAALKLGTPTEVPAGGGPPDSSATGPQVPIAKTPKPKPKAQKPPNSRSDGNAWDGGAAPIIPDLPWEHPPAIYHDFYHDFLTKFGYRDFLTKFGYVVVETPFTDKAERFAGRAAFDKMLRESPEFRPPADDADLDTWTPALPVLGGFSALGNPSSFHHPFVRRVREVLLHTALVEGVLPIARGDHVEKPFDRCTLRRPGQTPTGESLHRDEAPSALRTDTVFGGWLNLDDSDQTFRCAPGTHLEVGGQNKGFAKIAHPDEMDHYSRQIRSIPIPAGKMLVFYERIVHEVAAIKRACDEPSMYRVHCGFRLTKQLEPLFTGATTRDWIQQQAVPRIKSSQWPAVFPSSYTNFPDGRNLAAGMKNVDWLPTWSQKTFVDDVLVTKVIGGNGPHAGTSTRRVDAVMKPLSVYFTHDKMHKAYSDQESALLFPQAKWPELHTSLTGNATAEVSLPSEYDWVLYEASVCAAPSGGRVMRPRPMAASS